MPGSDPRKPDGYSARSRGQPPRPRHQERNQSLLALAFTWVAGYVDVVGYLTLFHLFTANMSGNTVHAGVSLAHGHGWNALRRLYPVLIFFGGMVLAWALHEVAHRRRLKHGLSVALAVEGLCLLGFLIAGSFWFTPGHGPPVRLGQAALLIGLLSVAMGVQNASLTQVGTLDVHTTHVTGTLATFAHEVVRCAYWMYDHTLGRFPRRPAVVARLIFRRRQFRDAAVIGLLWIVYLAGAAAAAVAVRRWGFVAVAVPLTVIAIACIATATTDLAAWDAGTKK